MQRFLALSLLLLITSAALATPPIYKHRLPKIVSFSVAYAKRLTANGYFKGSCLIHPKFPLRAKLYVTPNTGVRLMEGEGQYPLHLEAKKSFVVNVSGNLVDNAKLPTGVNLKLRYKLPLKSIYRYVSKTSDSPYNDEEVRKATLVYIKKLKADGNIVREQNRCFMLDERGKP